MSRTTLVVMCVLMASLGMSAQVAAGDIFKWTDDKGVVHYSDRPHDSKAVKVELKVANVSKSNSIEPLGLEADKKAASLASDVKNINQQCQSLRQKMAQLAKNRQSDLTSVKALLSEQLEQKLADLEC